MKTKLTIFDLDGTLFNTSEVNFMSYSRAAKESGFTFDVDISQFHEISNGKDFKSFLPQLIPGISEKEMQNIHQAKQGYYKNYLQYAIKNEHLFSVISALVSTHVIALVTTASIQNVRDILNYFEVNDYFDLILSQEDVTFKKPSPEGFLKAIELAKVSINDVLIFEDSDVGIEAAKSSGAKFVRVYGYN
jgi:beta-phosphoglucomutase